MAGDEHATRIDSLKLNMYEARPCSLAVAWWPHHRTSVSLLKGKIIVDFTSGMDFSISSHSKLSGPKSILQSLQAWSSKVIRRMRSKCSLTHASWVKWSSTHVSRVRGTASSDAFSTSILWLEPYIWSWSSNVSKICCFVSPSAQSLRSCLSEARVSVVAWSPPWCCRSEKSPRMPGCWCWNRPTRSDRVQTIL